MNFTDIRTTFKPSAAKMLASACICAASLVQVSPALAQAAGGHGQHAMPATPGAGAAKSSMAMHTAMEDMNKRMKAMTMSGNQDMDFAMMMVNHHQGAIDMAQAQVASGKDPKMVSAAKKIIAAQKKEIAMFEAWMKKNGHSMK
ncbi:MAG: DUF305 domain-containing protein [Pseudomonadota bacterium]